MTKEIKKSPADDKNLSFWLDVGTRIVGKIGITGFAVVSIVSFIYQFASLEQKQAIIDTWLLFKGGPIYPAVLINLTLFLLLIVQQLHYTKNGKLLSNRIDELALEKSNLQKRLLGNKELPTSQKKPK